MKKTGRLLDLYITANSPGEITGWAAPVIREVKMRARNSRITVVIVPCQYASGDEMRLAASAGADRVIRIGDIGRAIKEDAAVSASASYRKLALRLGGDFFFAVYMSRRLGCPLWAYSNRPRWPRFVERYFVPDERASRLFAIMDLPPERFSTIGHLALDSVVLSEDEKETREYLGLDESDTVVSFITGSRPVEYLRAVPYFVKTASAIADAREDCRIFFPLAPTVDEEQLCVAAATNGLRWKGETKIREIFIGRSQSGEERWARVIRGRTLELLNCSALAIAVPGTSNLQAAALYTPLIMVLPLDDAEHFPVDGIMGAIPISIPGMKSLKRRFIMHLERKTDFISLPNRMAGRSIVPEIRGIFPQEVVAERAIALLNDKEKLQEMSRQFWELTHERGAAGLMADQISDWLERER